MIDFPHIPVTQDAEIVSQGRSVTFRCLHLGDAGATGRIPESVYRDAGRRAGWFCATVSAIRDVTDCTCFRAFLARYGRAQSAPPPSG